MPFKSLKTKLDTAFLIVFLIPLIAATIFSINYLSQNIKEHALARLSSDLELVVLLLNHQTTEMRHIAESYGHINYWALSLNLGLASRLKERLYTEATLRNLDEILILDLSGRIAVATGYSQDEAVHPVPEYFLQGGLRGAVTEGIELIKTTQAQGAEQPLLSLTGSTPLYHPYQSGIIGAVVVRRYLRSDFLKRVLPSDLVPDTFLYSGKILVASNVGNPDAQESGTMNTAIAQALYQWGEPVEEVKLETGGYLSKYRPLVDAEGALAGALMVRMSADSYSTTRFKAFVFLCGMFFLGLVMMLLNRYLIRRNILEPIRILIRGTRSLAGGDYSYRLAVTSQDEVGALAQSFDRMAARLEKRTAELEAAHQRLQDIIEFLPDATFVIDHEKKVIAWNRAMENITEIPKEEILGKGKYAYAIPFYGIPRPLLIDLVASDAPAPDPPYECFERHGNILFAEHFVPSAYGGKGADLWLTASPLFDPDDNLIGAIESIRDITDRKQAQRSLQESESRLRQLSSMLLTAQEEERKRVAREVHDSIASSLAAINISLGNCLIQLEQGLSAVGPIKHSIAITLNAMEESRRIMSDLRPSVLDDFGILATIDWLCRQNRTISPKVCIEKNVTLEEQEIPELLKIAIFRVLQEALNNVLKHSEAELVNLSLVRRDGCIELTIEDNGVGFNPDTARAKGSEDGGLGIASMRERTELSGGAFAIDSSPEMGTVVRCSWRHD